LNIGDVGGTAVVNGFGQVIRGQIFVGAANTGFTPGTVQGGNGTLNLTSGSTVTGLTAVGDQQGIGIVDASGSDRQLLDAVGSGRGSCLLLTTTPNDVSPFG
jgi:hypothetical protein